MKTYDNLLHLLNIPSPSGMTEEAIAFVETRIRALGVPCERTAKGALVAHLKGRDKSPGITLSAHIDTLGLMVRAIRENGRLTVVPVGGYSSTAIDGETVKIHAHDKIFTGTVLSDHASVHVYDDTRTREHTFDNLEVRIDARTYDRETTEKLGIRPGDYVSLDTHTTETEDGFIRSRHLDDKACAAILLSLIETLKDEELPWNVHFFFSNFEEVGHGSSAGIPDDTVTLLALDMACVGSDLSGHEEKVSICALDSTGPYDLTVRRHLTMLAEKETLDHVIDIYPHYGSDASAALRAGGNFKTGLIGPGVDASHAQERTHKNGIEATEKLALAFVRNPV